MVPRQMTLAGTQQTQKIYSIGYGGRNFKVVMQILSVRDVEVLVDVRGYPNTKWFGKEFLEDRLGDNYKSIPALGAKEFTPFQYKEWRAKVPDQILDELVQLTESKTICLMCSEKDHRKCHRFQFIGRALKEDYGIEVQHI